MGHTLAGPALTPPPDRYPGRRAPPRPGDSTLTIPPIRTRLSPSGAIDDRDLSESPQPSHHHRSPRPPPASRRQGGDPGQIVPIGHPGPVPGGHGRRQEPPRSRG